MIKNLLKEDKNKDIFKIIAVLIVYIIVFGIFRAGLDFQKIIPAKNYEKPKEVVEYSYTIISNNSPKIIKFNEKKSLTQILDGFFEKNIEIRIIRDGHKIESIYNSKNISVTINNEKIETSLIRENIINENSVIVVNY